MAHIKVRYYSECLVRDVEFGLYIPNDIRGEEERRKISSMKTLILLHGYTGCGDNWMPQDVSDKYNFAVVTPNGENSFWLDGLSTGHRFASFLGGELIGYLRDTFGLARTPDDTYIMGLSMGGFGALHTAFAYPDVYGKTAALSSALIVHNIAGMKPGATDAVANAEYYRECFGDLDKVEESRNNPEVLVKELKDGGKKIPEILMACGTEDFLIEENRAFHRFLEGIGVEHTYVESEGIHDMKFWSEYARKFGEKMFA